jgi:hypothetical protein
MSNNIGHSSIFPSTGLGAAGSIGPTGPTGANQTVPGPTGSTGINSNYITLVNVTPTGQVEFTLSDGTVVSPGIFKGATGIYAGITATTIGTGIPVLKGVCGGITLEFYNFRSGGILGVTYSSFDNLKFTILDQNIGGGISASTENNRIVYFKQRNYVMSTDLAPQRANSSIRVGDNDYGYINFGTESSGRNVVTDIRDTLFTLGPIERGERIVTTDTFFDQGSPEGITLDVSRATVYQLITPIGIKGFKYDAIPDGQVMSVTLFIDGEDVWNFPSDVVFDEASKPIFYPGMNILHMWRTNQDDKWRAHFTARGFGVNEAINPGLRGSCCYFDVDDEKHCEDYVTQTYCDERDGTFEPMVPCTKNKCITDTAQKTYDGVCCSEGRCISDIDPSFCQAINGQFISGITCGDVGIFPDNDAQNYTTYNSDGSVLVESGLCYNNCKDTSVYCCKDGECLGQLTEEYCKYLGGKTVKNVNSCSEAKCCDSVSAPGACCIPVEDGYSCQEVQTPYECNTTLNGIYMGKNTNCDTTKCDCNTVPSTCYRCNTLPENNQCNCQQVSVNLRPGETCEEYSTIGSSNYFTTQEQCVGFCSPVECSKCQQDGQCIDKQLCGGCGQVPGQGIFNDGNCTNYDCNLRTCFKPCTNEICQCLSTQVPITQTCPQTHPNDSCDCSNDCGGSGEEQTVACFWCFAHIENNGITDSLLSPIVLEPNGGMMGGYIKYQGLYDGRFRNPNIAPNDPGQWLRIQPDLVPGVDNLSITNPTPDDIDAGISTLGEYLESIGSKRVAELVADQSVWKEKFIKQSQAPYRAVALIDENIANKLNSKQIDDVTINTKTGVKQIQLDSETDLFTPVQIPYFIEEWPDNTNSPSYPVDKLKIDTRTSADVLGVRGKFKCYYVGSYNKTSNPSITRARCLTRFGYTPDQQTDCKLCDPIPPIEYGFTNLSQPPSNFQTTFEKLEPYQEEIENGILAPFPPLWGRITYKFDRRVCGSNRHARVTHNLRLLNYKTITDMCLATFNGELKYFMDLLHTDYIDIENGAASGKLKVVKNMVRGIKESMGVPESINATVNSPNPDPSPLELLQIQNFNSRNTYYNRLLGDYVFEDQTPEFFWTEWIDSPFRGKKLFGAGCVQEGYLQYDPYMLCNSKSYKGAGIQWSYWSSIADNCGFLNNCNDIFDFNNPGSNDIPEAGTSDPLWTFRVNTFVNYYRHGFYGDPINRLCEDGYTSLCSTFDGEGISSTSVTLFYPRKQTLLHGDFLYSTGELWFEVPGTGGKLKCTTDTDENGEYQDPIRDNIGFSQDAFPPAWAAGISSTTGDPLNDFCESLLQSPGNGTTDQLYGGIPRGILGRNLRYNLEAYRTYSVFYNRSQTTHLNGSNAKSLSQAERTAVPIIFIQGAYWQKSCGAGVEALCDCKNVCCCVDACLDSCSFYGTWTEDECGGTVISGGRGGGSGSGGGSGGSNSESCEDGPTEAQWINAYIVSPSTVGQTEPLTRIKTGEKTKYVKLDEGLCVHIICPECNLYESC